MMQRAQNSGGGVSDLASILLDKPSDNEETEKEERRRRKKMRENYETPSKTAQPARDIEMTDLPQGAPDVSMSMDQTYEDNLEDELGGNEEGFYGEEQTPADLEHNYFETNPNDISGYCENDGQVDYDNEFKTEAQLVDDGHLQT